MTTNPFPMVAALESGGLQAASEDQFLAAGQELKLSDLAREVARRVLECPAAIARIAAVASIRALGQAAFQYRPSMGPLADYLLDATKHWAIQFSSMPGEKCLQISEVTFSEALKQEAELMARRKNETINNDDQGNPLSSFRQLLTESEIPFTESGNEIHFKMLLGTVGCDCFVICGQQAISVIFYSPIFVPTNRQGEIAKALAWANWQAPFGAFEMNLEDGQVRFHYSLPLIGQINDEHAQMMISVARTAMRRYVNSLSQIMNLAR